MRVSRFPEELFSDSFFTSVSASIRMHSTNSMISGCSVMYFAAGCTQVLHFISFFIYNFLYFLLFYQETAMKKWRNEP